MPSKKDEAAGASTADSSGEFAGRASAVAARFEMTRRDAAWLVARAAAVLGAAEFFGRWMDAQSLHQHNVGSHAAPDPHDWENYQPRFFSTEQYAILDSFTAILIPSDDTPGARDAYVAAFIDFVVAAASEYAPQMQTQWLNAMRWLEAQRFGALSADAQTALISQMAETELDRTKTHPGYGTYKLIKDMTIHAFYTSRAGLIGALEYKGLAYLTEFPGCDHPEHHGV